MGLPAKASMAARPSEISGIETVVKAVAEVMMSELRNNVGASRYEMDEQGQTSWADYRLNDGRLYIDHVESPPTLRGTGAAGRLMQALAADARERGLKITPICGYAAAWLRRSPDYRDLVT